MSVLDLKELDRLAREMQGRQYYAHPKRRNPPYFLMRSREEAGTWGSVANYGAEWHEIELSAGIRNQLRPLLDLVEKMGEALAFYYGSEDEGWKPWNKRMQEDCGKAAQDVLKEYRRAKGE